MVEWLGQLLASVPSWLYLPALIIISIISIAVWLSWNAAGATILPFKQKRVDVGEKKK